MGKQGVWTFKIRKDGCGHPQHKSNERECANDQFPMYRCPMYKKMGMETQHIKSAHEYPNHKNIMWELEIKMQTIVWKCTLGVKVD